ncbi:MAG: beta-ketoacyl-ACP synthase I [Candidatus Pacebacteria bacterium]|nr:beta-ketoacyl-ACP synthase I [Candidatus Paceibacterota bacterium]
MKRVVITGMGAVSPIGLSQKEITEALWKGHSGICINQDYVDLKFRSSIAGIVKMDQLPPIDRRIKRHMGKGDTILLGYHAMLQAVADSGLPEGSISHPMTGCILGTGGPSTWDQTISSQELYNQNQERPWQKCSGPLTVVPAMSSGLLAKVANDFCIKGDNFSITSACATSAHAIGEASLKIAFGRQTIMFAGGADDCHPTKACGFEALGALATIADGTNPAHASRPYDKNRNGFVDAAGGGVLVLEEYEHARKRNARIYGEVVGYGLSGDGDGDMTSPGFHGPLRAVQQALRGLHSRVRNVRYVNAHGTSTKAGDVNEVRVIKAAFSRRDVTPWITSTKSLTGHALGGAGVLEAIYTILMLRRNFIAASANIDEIDPEIVEMGMDKYIPRARIDNANVQEALSNSFGFGGTNACLALRVRQI